MLTVRRRAGQVTTVSPSCFTGPDAAAHPHLRRAEVDTSVARFLFCRRHRLQILIRVNPDKYVEQRVQEILSDSRQVLLGYWKDQQKSSNRLIFVLILALIQAFWKTTITSVVTTVCLRCVVLLQMKGKLQNAWSSHELQSSGLDKTSPSYNNLDENECSPGSDRNRQM